ncbi:uncharacterized protein B0I36DRAFT_378332 [Microdochium trichocladiopsis]|uniref:Azaphilone pigments biosynthesis cluster protein L N-terminal domain-containing protein n=1 Tax=Microdochium trichocladiopsis TaxID=1682393 RepID=A0A9P9BLA5_9PEZI|nr:uncharacterized protein B0I36DRAFT_378332 [Microdochium trichocladiopsis]KAH7012594.1 hypothetical protein B0I36DRAFT_378332 [Microdochium trichocladiopsis]
MDPLSITASAIAVATLAAQSTKAIYQAIDGLAEAPHAIAHSKTLLAGTQTALDSLIGTLTTTQDTQARLGSVLRPLELDQTLRSTQQLCDKFGTTITKYTSRSTDARFSSRDRILVNFHESQIIRFNQELGDCQKTISLVLGTITLIVSSGTSDNLQQLSKQFQAHEQALTSLVAEISQRPTDPGTIESHTSGEGLRASTDDDQASLRPTLALRNTCEAALQATQAARTAQTFGDMQADQSMAMQGIVGEAQKGVDQSFGKLVAQNKSRAFQGQMDATSFAQMFK